MFDFLIKKFSEEQEVNNLAIYNTLMELGYYYSTVSIFLPIASDYTYDHYGKHIRHGVLVIDYLNPGDSPECQIALSGVIVQDNGSYSFRESANNLFTRFIKISFEDAQSIIKDMIVERQRNIRGFVNVEPWYMGRFSMCLQ